MLWSSPQSRTSSKRRSEYVIVTERHPMQRPTSLPREKGPVDADASCLKSHAYPRLRSKHTSPSPAPPHPEQQQSSTVGVFRSVAHSAGKPCCSDSRLTAKHNPGRRSRACGEKCLDAPSHASCTLSTGRHAASVPFPPVGIGHPPVMRPGMQTGNVRLSELGAKGQGWR